MPEPGVALVTGAARRIGRAIAIDLARAGWAVALHGRTDDDDLKSALDEVRSSGARGATLIADLAREEQSVALVERARTALGPVTCLVNSASAFEYDVVGTATRASWDLHLETNLRAPFVLTREMARLLPAGANGNVVH